MTWQYIAGFYDGEGSLIRHGRGHGFRALISQAHHEVLISIQTFAKMGYIFKNRKRKSHWKESWVYGVSRQKDLYQFLKNVQPYCIVKREKIGYALPIIQKNLAEDKARLRLRERRFNAALGMRQSGYTYRRIGRKLGVDFGYIRRLLKKDRTAQWWA